MFSVQNQPVCLWWHCCLVVCRESQFSQFVRSKHFQTSRSPTLHPTAAFSQVFDESFRFCIKKWPRDMLLSIPGLATSSLGQVCTMQWLICVKHILCTLSNPDSLCTAGRVHFLKCLMKVVAYCRQVSFCTWIGNIHFGSSFAQLCTKKVLLQKCMHFLYRGCIFSSVR